MEQIRKCTKCNLEYPLTSEYFYRDKKGREGFSSRCKNCHKKYALEHKEHKQQYMKEWKHDNKEHVSEYNHAWYESHKEERKVYNHRWHINNKESRQLYDIRRRTNPEIREREQSKSISYYYAHQDTCKENHRKWIKKNPSKSRYYGIKRRTLENSLPFNFTIINEQHALKYWQNRCAYCGRILDLSNSKSWAFDHWISISDPRPDNPGTVPINLLPACHGNGGCNSSKLNKDPLIWLYKKFPDTADMILVGINIYFQSLKDEEALDKYK